MPDFTAGQSLDIPSFTRQIEGDEAIIGRPETGVFLTLPIQALEIVDALAAGATVADARDSYARRHGETPDMGDLLDHLAAHGLIRSAGQTADEENVFVDQFGWIPRSFARAVFSPAVGGVAVVLCTAALVAVMAQPSLLPGWRAAYFPRDTAVLLFAMMVLGLGTTFFHELGHVLAARAEGVATRFGIGNRLWFVVWETDMTGVWALPRRRRYLPILAGPLVDLISASLLVLFSFAVGQGWLQVSPLGAQIARALLLIYLLRLLWQAYFFVRTDYYYAVANALGCKSLMADTEALWRERWARLRGRETVDSLRHLSAIERRAVRIYSGVWLVGRLVALGVLFAIQLPLFVQYGGLLWTRVTSGAGVDPGTASVTTWLPIVLFVLLFGTGMVMWIRGLTRHGDTDPTLARPREPAHRLEPSHLEMEPRP